MFFSLNTQGDRQPGPFIPAFTGYALPTKTAARNPLPVLQSIFICKIPFDSKILIYVYSQQQTSRLSCFRPELQRNFSQQLHIWKMQSWDKSDPEENPVLHGGRMKCSCLWNQNLAILGDLGRGMKIRDAGVCVWALPLAIRSTSHTASDFLSGILFLFSFTHAPTLVPNKGGYRVYVGKTKWQILSQPSRASMLSLISNYFQSPVHNIIGSLYQNMLMPQLDSGKEQPLPTPFPMTKTPDRNQSLVAWG